jgi:hypothetical protein
MFLVEGVAVEPIEVQLALEEERARKLTTLSPKNTITGFSSAVRLVVLGAFVPLPDVDHSTLFFRKSSLDAELVESSTAEYDHGP